MNDTANHSKLGCQELVYHVQQQEEGEEESQAPRVDGFEVVKMQPRGYVALHTGAVAYSGECEVRWVMHRGERVALQR